MKNCVIFLSILIALLSAVISGFAEEDLLWSNFNNDPVKNIPQHYPVFSRDEDLAPVLITRIRTYHWNNGNGAEPGQICIREGNTTKEIQCWQAVGRSAYGVSNVYWEVLTDFIMEPGHSYGFRPSDFDSWSNNEASNYFGMIELYGENPAPDTYTVSASKSSSSVIPSTLSAGKSFTFGTYEQDNNTSNGKEPIEWEVLTVQGDRALVISKYGLDVMNYYETLSDINWEYSYVRKWLNNTFYDNAFTAAEKNRILLVTNDNPDNYEFGTYGGNQTQDRVFLLSIDEANRYFSKNSQRSCIATSYAKTYDISVSDNDGGTSWWWLRSPGMSKNQAAVVNPDGSVFTAGYGVQNQYGVVRPAFWLKISGTPTPTPRPRTCYKVTYVGNNCLAKVPSDDHCYQLGDLVTVLFEPVEYMQGLIFNGWDMDDDGTADFGYYYPTFAMPGYDVQLKAICYQQYYNNDQYYDVTTDEVDRQQYYNPYNDPTLNNDIYDPNTGWWYSPEYYYDGVG